MKTPDHYIDAFGSILPQLTPASLETLTGMLARSGVSLEALAQIQELKADVDRAVMHAEDPKLAYNRSTGELLRW